MYIILVNDFMFALLHYLSYTHTHKEILTKKNVSSSASLRKSSTSRWFNSANFSEISINLVHLFFLSLPGFFVILIFQITRLCNMLECVVSISLQRQEKSFLPWLWSTNPSLSVLLDFNSTHHRHGLIIAVFVYHHLSLVGGKRRKKILFSFDEKSHHCVPFAFHCSQLTTCMFVFNNSLLFVRSSFPFLLRLLSDIS